jgi:hypothetical protein
MVVAGKIFIGSAVPIHCEDQIAMLAVHTTLWFMFHISTCPDVMTISPLAFSLLSAMMLPLE